MNREQWLTTLSGKMRSMFETHGGIIPTKLRLTCGWPSKGAFSSKRRTIGECWQKAASKDGTTEIFISPCLSSSSDVAAVLTHELIHACGNMGHKGPFKRLALAVGLEGPMRATIAGRELTERLNALIKPMGDYPHAVLDKSQSPHKKEGTRLLKVLCLDCGYTVRTTQKWIDCGTPTCPCGSTMEVA